MLIHFIVPCSEGNIADSLQANIQLLLRFTNSKLVITHVDYIDSTNVSLSVTTDDKVVLFKETCELENLPYNNENYIVLRLVLLAIDVLSLYKRSLDKMENLHNANKLINKALIILEFIRDFVKLVG